MQWGFKQNSAPATSETWHLKGHTLKVNTTILYLLLNKTNLVYCLMIHSTKHNMRLRKQKDHWKQEYDKTAIWKIKGEYYAKTDIRNPLKSTRKTVDLNV